MHRLIVQKGVRSGGLGRVRNQKQIEISRNTVRSPFESPHSDLPLLYPLSSNYPSTVPHRHIPRMYKNRRCHVRSSFFFPSKSAHRRVLCSIFRTQVNRLILNKMEQSAVLAVLLPAYMRIPKTLNGTLHTIHHPPTLDGITPHPLAVIALAAPSGRLVL